MDARGVQATCRRQAPPTCVGLSVRPSVRSVVKVADLASSSVLRGTLSLSLHDSLPTLLGPLQPSVMQCWRTAWKCGFTALFAPVTSSSQVTLGQAAAWHDIAIWDIRSQNYQNAKRGERGMTGHKWLRIGHRAVVVAHFTTTTSQLTKAMYYACKNFSKFQHPHSQ